MSSNKLIINARIVNEGQVKKGSLLIENEIIAAIFDDPQPADLVRSCKNVIDAQNCYLLPGIIDDQVHFREPGLTHKADIASESKAAVAGGVTSFMEMPNTLPAATTIQLLDEKFKQASQKSLANYSFYLGASNENLEELQKADTAKVCGIKVFMGSSTGNMLVNDPQTLENIFARTNALIAVHCEDESTIQSQLQLFKEKYGDQILPEHHPMIRNHQACFLSSEKAVKLAQKHKTRLHVLHLSTGQETSLFDAQTPLEQKRITAEVCVHHLWFSKEDYAEKQNFIKWNPAIKDKSDRKQLWEGLLNGKLDVVATDHAPHLSEEKTKPYLQAPSGGPLVQHAMQAMADALLSRLLPIYLLPQWMSHNPAICFKVNKRGFIREGYYADLVILNPGIRQTVTKDNILYKCKWSPFEGHTFQSTPTHTFINGELVYDNGRFAEHFTGKALEFNA